MKPKTLIFVFWIQPQIESVTLREAPINEHESNPFLFPELNASKNNIKILTKLADFPANGVVLAIIRAVGKIVFSLDDPVRGPV